MTIDLELLNVLRNMAYEFQNEGLVLYDLVNNDYDAEANQAARDKQQAAIDWADQFIIDQRLRVRS